MVDSHEIEDIVKTLNAEKGDKKAFKKSTEARQKGDTKKMRPLLYTILWGLTFLLIGFALMIGYECVYGDDIPAYTIRIADIAAQTYDGDTINDVNILVLDHSFGMEDVGQLWPGVFATADGIEIVTDIRIRGIDTPEKRTSTKNPDGSKRSEASRQREKAAAVAARQALIDILKGAKVISLSSPIHGKYGGRTVADVAVDEVDVATLLIQQGHAKAYDGGTKPDWQWGD